MTDGSILRDLCELVSPRARGDEETPLRHRQWLDPTGVDVLARELD